MIYLPTAVAMLSAAAIPERIAPSIGLTLAFTKSPAIARRAGPMLTQLCTRGNTR